MRTDRSSTSDVVDLARVLLLFQGCLLLATTIEALVWLVAFPGAVAVPFLASAAAAATLLVARIRLRPDRRRIRRLVYAIEIAILLAFAIDLVLAVLLAHALPPIVAIATRFVLPVTVIGLLRRCDATSAMPAPAVAAEAAA